MLVNFGSWHYWGGQNSESIVQLSDVVDVLKMIIDLHPASNDYGIIVRLNGDVVYNSFLDKSLSLEVVALRILNSNNRIEFSNIKESL